MTRRSLMLALFVIAVFFGVPIHFANLLPTIVNVLCCAVTLIAGWSGILIYLTMYQNALLKIWLYIVVYMIAVGFVRAISGDLYYTNVSALVLQDCRYVMYMAIGFCYGHKAIYKSYHYLIQVLGGLAVVLGLVGIASFDYSTIAILRRSNTWTLSYYCWWMSASVFVYLFAYCRMYNKQKILGYAVFVTYLMLGILFLKRAALVNGGVLLLLVVFLSMWSTEDKYKISNVYQTLMGVISLALAFFAVVTAFSYAGVSPDEYLYGLSDRFAGESMATYDRAEEATYFWGITDINQKMLGRGLGNYLVAPDGHDIVAIHIGWYNHLYTGGVLLLTFWFIIACALVKMIIQKKIISKNDKLCACVTAAALISMFYEWSFTSSLFPFGYAACIAYLYNKQSEGRS